MTQTPTQIAEELSEEQRSALICLAQDGPCKRCAPHVFANGTPPWVREARENLEARALIEWGEGWEVTPLGRAVAAHLEASK